tara:strand:+ start:636 stop:803 length:168 start_codon:yes stop_codon:yes gene_type:complete
MKIKENDFLPNSEVFILESGEPTKKNIEDFFKKKKNNFIWFAWGVYISMFQKTSA